MRLLTRWDTHIECGSRGLGALVAEKLAAEGCNVAINYNESKDRAEAVAKKITEDFQVKVIVLQGVRDDLPRSRKVTMGDLCRMWVCERNAID